MKLRYLAIIAAITLLIIAAGCAKKAAAPAPTAPTAPAAPAAATPPATAPAEETTTTEATSDEEKTADEKLAEAPALETGSDVTQTTQENKDSTGLASDLTAESEAFPMAQCDLKEIDGKQVRVLTVQVKNIETDEWVIYGKENPKGKVRVGNRGIVDITPGCEATTLAAGESTNCATLDNGAVIQGQNRVTVNTPVKQYARVVDCP